MLLTDSTCNLNVAVHVAFSKDGEGRLSSTPDDGYEPPPDDEGNSRSEEQLPPRRSRSRRRLPASDEL